MVMIEEHRIVVPGVLQNIRDICDFVVVAAERAGLNEKAIHHCQMAVDEACTNIIEHGYTTSGQEGSIEVICRDQPERFTISLLDESPPFNPLNRSDPDPDMPLNERLGGGWGIYFIKKMMDEIAYQLDQGRNRLDIVKFKTPDTLAAQPDSTDAETFPVRYLSKHAIEVIPSGRIDSNTSSFLEQTFNYQVKDSTEYVLVNMQQVSYISTSGLKVLVNAWRRVRDHNGELVLFGMTAHVFEAFEIVGFDQIFEIYDSIDEARQALDNNQT